jgi:hypothetical protein
MGDNLAAVGCVAAGQDWCSTRVFQPLNSLTAMHRESLSLGIDWTLRTLETVGECRMSVNASGIGVRKRMPGRRAI